MHRGADTISIGFYLAMDLSAQMGYTEVKRGTRDAWPTSFSLARLFTLNFHVRLHERGKDYGGLVAGKPGN